MRTVVAAVIEREDRRLLIGQRRKDDSSPLKWEFPGGKVREGEAAGRAVARGVGASRPRPPGLPHLSPRSLPFPSRSIIHIREAPLLPPGTHWNRLPSSI